MQPLFAGKVFATVMTDRLGQMQKEIEKLKCADVEGFDEKTLSAKAEKLAEKYVPRDIPKANSAGVIRDHSINGQLFWLLPFTGNTEYFSFMPTAQLTAIDSNHFVEKIENGQIYFVIGETSSSSLKDSENRAQGTVATIDRCLQRMQQDADSLYSLEKMKEAALAIFKKKQGSCAKLRSLGYAVR